MASERTAQVIKDINSGKKLAFKIIKNLEIDDVQEKLNTLDLLDRLAPLPIDDPSRELKEYEETKQVYKRLYTLAARTIMQIISSNFFYGTHDPAHSFNYNDPLEPLKAAEKIQYLPKAYMGGPIKAAVTSPYLKVNKIGAFFYNELPSDIKYSNAFPDTLRKKIRMIKSK